MVEDVIGKMSADKKAEHRSRIAIEFGDFRRDLERLVSKMYVDHFTDDLTKSPEYASIVDSAAKLEQATLERYKP